MITVISHNKERLDCSDKQSHVSALKKKKPGGGGSGNSLVVQWLGSPSFHCRGHGFNPSLGN